ncbi:hypothetical protein RJ639_002777 [Escallonia herrerae]|uniref:histone deacetylase n=1 Tax=Escallonia herrerae TaxID=1293975 RepID=A0AA88W578_9ASTE|nr:hypothetical protein RJ639_002777 [Escallonia herrerae]
MVLPKMCNLPVEFQSENTIDEDYSNGSVTSKDSVEVREEDGRIVDSDYPISDDEVVKLRTIEVGNLTKAVDMVDMTLTMHQRRWKWIVHLRNKGNCKEQYEKLWNYRAEVLRSNPNTTFDLEVQGDPRLSSCRNYLVDSFHMKTEQIMASEESLQMSRLLNGKAENNLHNQKDQIHCQRYNQRLGNLGSVGISASMCQDDGDSGEASGLSSRDTANDLNGDMLADVISKEAGRDKDMTLEDMYNNQNGFDDEDDDSDWEPLETRIAVTKWFCINCTMVNFDDHVHCDICGEHKKSQLLKHGFFASPLSQEAGPIWSESELSGKGLSIHKSRPLVELLGCLEQDDSEVDLNLIEEKSTRRGVYSGSCSGKLASQSSTAVGFDERMLLHSEVEMKSHPHPERPDRLQAIAASLATAGIFPGRCFSISAREITREELQMVHALENIEAVELTSRFLASYFTSDTYANEHSALAARLAAGLCADLARAIFSGRFKNGFALVRPPGHHAGVKQAMGFCLHNNAAVAASAAQAAGAKRVLIVDWDVHHGNGTQEIFEQCKSVLYISLHRHEGGIFYPGTGAANEVGTQGAEGYCVNVPWSRGGVGDNDYIFAFQHVVRPIVSEFAPDFTIISAGFDAARGDPLGCCDVTPAGFAQMTEMLSSLGGGKLLVILEGGYNLRAISSSATSVIKVLLGESPECHVDDVVPSKAGLQTVLEVLKIQMTYWPTLENVMSELKLRWRSYDLQEKRKEKIKRRRTVVPIWWKWGRKRFLYRVLSEHLQLKSKGC